MADQYNEVLSKQLHPEAEGLAREYIEEFAASLILQAKLFAYVRRDDVVLCNHIREALEAIHKERKQNWSRE